jgi:hypothetical protein
MDEVFECSGSVRRKVDIGILDTSNLVQEEETHDPMEPIGERVATDIVSKASELVFGEKTSLECDRTALCLCTEELLTVGWWKVVASISQGVEESWTESVLVEGMELVDGDPMGREVFIVEGREEDAEISTRIPLAKVDVGNVMELGGQSDLQKPCLRGGTKGKGEPTYRIAHDWVDHMYIL